MVPKARVFSTGRRLTAAGLQQDCGVHPRQGGACSCRSRTCHHGRSYWLLKRRPVFQHRGAAEEHRGAVQGVWWATQHDRRYASQMQVQSLGVLADAAPECIRVREIEQGRLGHVLRPASTTLQALKVPSCTDVILASPVRQIAAGASLCLEALDQPDTSTGNAILLHVCIRDPAAKVTSRPVEIVYEGGPTPNVSWRMRARQAFTSHSSRH